MSGQQTPSAGESGRPWLERALWLALCGVIIATPWGPLARVGLPSFAQSGALVIGAALCGLLLTTLALGDRRPLGWRARLWGGALAGNGASLAASSLGAEEPLAAAVAALPSLAALIFLATAIVALRPAGRQIRFLALWTAIGAGLSLIAIAQALGLAGFLSIAGDAPGKTKVASLFGHPNHFASALTPIMFLTLSWLSLAGRPLFPALALATQAIALTLSGSRGAWLGCLAGLAVWAMLARRRAADGRRSARWPGWALALGLLAGGALLAPNPWREPVYRMGERLTSTTEIRSRLHSWLIAIDLARQRPLVGHGPGGYAAHYWQAVSQRQATADGQWTETTVIHNAGIPPGHAHNDWLQMAAERGMVGILMVGFIIGLGLAAAWRWRSLPVAAGLGGGIVAVCVDACFLYPFHLPFSLIAISALLAMAARMDSPKSPNP